MRFRPQRCIDGGEARSLGGYMCTSPVFPVVAENDLELPWHVLHVRPNCERKTSTFLTYRGYQILLPAQRRAAARNKQIDVPLFPGYVFCQFDPANLSPILSAPGIVQILSRDHKPEPVPESEIFALQSLVRANWPMQPAGLYATGDPIRITAGPLTGVEGRIVRDAGRPRLVVLVSMLNRSVVTEIDREWIDLARNVHAQMAWTPGAPASAAGGRAV